MLKVTNKLGLTNDASEDSILAAIEKVTNSAAEAQARATELETEKAEKEKELVEVQNKLNELQVEKDQLEADKKAADEVALNEKATTMVTNFAKAGRIKNDAGTIAKWVSKAKADFDGTKELIEELPVNSQSIKIPVTNSVETPAQGKGNYAAKALAAVRTKNSK